MSAVREWRVRCALDTRARVGSEKRSVTLTWVSETGCGLTGRGAWRIGSPVALLCRFPPVAGRIVRIEAELCEVAFDRRLSPGEVDMIQNGKITQPGHFTEMR